MEKRGLQWPAWTHKNQTLNRIDEEQSLRLWQLLDLFDIVRPELEILLAFFLLVNGVDNGLPFSLVATT